MATTADRQSIIERGRFSTFPLCHQPRHRADEPEGRYPPFAQNLLADNAASPLIRPMVVMGFILFALGAVSMV